MQAINDVGMYPEGSSDGGGSAEQAGGSPTAQSRSSTPDGACAAFVRDARKTSTVEGAHVAGYAAEDTASSVDVQEAVSSVDMQEAEEGLSSLLTGKVESAAAGKGEEMAMTDEDDASTDAEGGRESGATGEMDVLYRDIGGVGDDVGDEYNADADGDSVYDSGDSGDPLDGTAESDERDGELGVAEGCTSTSTRETSSTLEPGDLQAEPAIEVRARCQRTARGDTRERMV